MALRERVCRSPVAAVIVVLVLGPAVASFFVTVLATPVETDTPLGLVLLQVKATLQVNSSPAASAEPNRSPYESTKAWLSGAWTNFWPQVHEVMSNGNLAEVSTLGSSVPAAGREDDAPEKHHAHSKNSLSATGDDHHHVQKQATIAESVASNESALKDGGNNTHASKPQVVSVKLSSELQQDATQVAQEPKTADKKEHKKSHSTEGAKLTKSEPKNTDKKERRKDERPAHAHNTVSAKPTTAETVNKVSAKPTTADTGNKVNAKPTMAETGKDGGKKAELGAVEDAEMMRKSESVHKTGSAEEAIADTLQENLASLRQRLSEIREEGQAKIARRRADHERNLSAQQRQNDDLVGDMATMVKDVKALEKANAHQRERGENLVMENGDFQARLKSLQENVTYASEFVQSALAGEAAEENATALEVLRELAQKDATKQKSAAGQQALAKIAEAGRAKEVSLLAAAHPALGEATLPSAGLTLQALEAGLEALRVEAAAAEASLDKAFMADYATGEARHLQLLGEKQDLEVKVAALQALGARLEVAVASLEKGQRYLKKSIVATEAWLGKLGSSPMPVSGAHVS